MYLLSSSDQLVQSGDEFNTGELRWNSSKDKNSSRKGKILKGHPHATAEKSTECVFLILPKLFHSVTNYLISALRCALGNVMAREMAWSSSSSGL